MLTFAPGLANNFALFNLAGQPTHPGNRYWPLAHVDLAGHPCGDYCSPLDGFAAEFDAMTAGFGVTSFDFDLLAQAAEKAATAAASCE